MESVVNGEADSDGGSLAKNDMSELPLRDLPALPRVTRGTGGLLRDGAFSRSDAINTDEDDVDVEMDEVDDADVDGCRPRPKAEGSEKEATVFPQYVANGVTVITGEVEDDDVVDDDEDEDEVEVEIDPRFGDFDSSRAAFLMISSP